MMQVVHCDTCGGSSIGLDSVSVDLTLTKGAWCDKCHHGHNQEQHHFFCSVDCFLSFAGDLANGKSNLHFKELKVVDGVLQLV